MSISRTSQNLASVIRTIETQHFRKDEDEDLFAGEYSMWRKIDNKPNAPFRRKDEAVVRFREHQHHRRCRLRIPQQDQQDRLKDPRRVGQNPGIETFDMTLERVRPRVYQWVGEHVTEF